MEEGRRVVAYGVVDSLAVLFAFMSGYKLWRILEVVLKKWIAFDAVGITLQDQWTVFEVREQHGRDSSVVPEQVSLSEAFSRPVDLVEVGEMDRVAVHRELNIRADCSVGEDIDRFAGLGVLLRRFSRLSPLLPELRGHILGASCPHECRRELDVAIDDYRSIR
jgi:hypothetical protein